MVQQNEYQSRDSALQNRFTGYLQVALRRTKYIYIQKQTRRSAREFPADPQASLSAYSSMAGMDGSRWNLSSDENAALDKALADLTARERFILYERVLNGTEYSEIAKVFGLRYSGAASAYHRIIKKLRKELRGDTE